MIELTRKEQKLAEFASLVLNRHGRILLDKVCTAQVADKFAQITPTIGAVGVLQKAVVLVLQ